MVVALILLVVLAATDGSALALSFLMLSAIGLKILTLNKNMLMSLLTLEVLMLLNLFFCSLLVDTNTNLVIFLTYITLAVCEACVGLGLLIQVVRSTGQSQLSRL